MFEKRGIFVFTFLPSFQNKLLQHNVQKGVIVSNQSLVLQKVTRSNGGNYTCIGYNAEGDGVSEPLYLNVMCKSS